MYGCNAHSCLWYLNFIAIPSFVCLHNERHFFADGFVTVRPIAMKFGRDKENVSRLKFRKLNPTNFNRQLTMMFKLDSKKIRLPHLQLRCKTGLMQKINIFYTENEHLHAFYAPTKIVQIGWGHHVNFCVWNKSAITFGEGCITDWWFQKPEISLYICHIWCNVPKRMKTGVQKTTPY